MNLGHEYSGEDAGLLASSRGKTSEAFNLSVEEPTTTYSFRINYFDWMNADGVSASRVLGINNKFPGPIIYADEGDMLTIEVINDIEAHEAEFTNTSLHWHGLLQEGSPMHDGVNHITQCPIRYEINL